MLEVELGPGEGEDSVSILSLLRGENDAAERSIVLHDCSGRFGLRSGDWVLIDAPTGDDNGQRGEPEWFKQERGYTAHDHPGELFNLREDISERRNLYAEHPEIVREMKAELERIKSEGT
jgi:arylsulfatase A